MRSGRWLASCSLAFSKLSPVVVEFPPGLAALSQARKLADRATRVFAFDTIESNDQSDATAGALVHCVWDCWRGVRSSDQWNLRQGLVDHDSAHIRATKHPALSVHPSGDRTLNNT